MNDFSVYAHMPFLHENCLENLKRVLERFVKVNLVLNWEIFHLMMKKAIVLGYLVSERGMEVDKEKI